MKPHLLRAHIQGYRCIEDVVFEPGPRMTVLVGANGTGKSSLLDALGLVSDLVRLGAGAFHGEVRGMLQGGLSPSELLTAGRREPLAVDLTFRTGSIEYGYLMRIELGRTFFRIVGERLLSFGDDGPRLLAERDPSGARIRRGQGGASQVVPVGVQDAASIVSLGTDGVSYPEVSPATRFLSGLCVLQPVPVLMRGPGSTATDSGWPDRYGRDLATRIFRLQNARPRSVAAWIGHLDFLGWTELRTPVTDGRVTPEILEGSNPNPIRLAQASDGSLAAAWLATFPLDPPEDVSVFLIDEPGTSFFPAALDYIGELLVALSHLRQVVVATQSANLVEQTGNLDNVWLVERTTGNPARLRRYPKDDDMAAEEVALDGIGRAAFHQVSPDLAEEGRR